MAGATPRPLHRLPEPPPGAAGAPGGGAGAATPEAGGGWRPAGAGAGAGAGAPPRGGVALGHSPEDEPAQPSIPRVLASERDSAQPVRAISSSGQGRGAPLGADEVAVRITGEDGDSWPSSSREPSPEREGWEGERLRPRSSGITAEELVERGREMDIEKMLNMAGTPSRMPRRQPTMAKRTSKMFLSALSSVKDYVRSLREVETELLEQDCAKHGTSMRDIDAHLISSRPRAGSSSASRASGAGAPGAVGGLHPITEEDEPAWGSAGADEEEGGEDARKTEWYLHPKYTLAINAEFREDIAHVCIDNAVKGETFFIRYATPAKLKLYRFLTCAPYLRFLCLVVLGHCTCAVFEPTSFRENAAAAFPEWDEYRRATQLTEVGCVAFYLFDLVGTLFCTTGKFFWGSAVMRCKFLVTLLILSDLICAFVVEGEYLRFSRVLRPFLFIFSSRVMREKLTPVVLSIVRVMRAISLIIFLLLIFGVVGMELFGNSRDWVQFEGEIDTCGFDFQNIGSAALSLYALLTSETYPCAMLPAIRGRLRAQAYAIPGLDPLNPNDWPRTRAPEFEGHHIPLSKHDYLLLQKQGMVEGSRESLTLFFIVFLLCVTFGFINIVVAIVYSTYRKYTTQMALRRRVEERKALLVAFELLAAVDGDTKNVDKLTFVKLVKRVMGKGIDDNKLQYYWKKTDRDCNGKVDAQEFIHLADVLGLTLVKVESIEAKRAYSAIQIALQKVTLSSYFESFMLLLIVANAVMICCKGLVNDKVYSDLMLANDVLTFVYLVEMILKMISTSVKTYFDGVWNIFDSFVTLLGVLSFVIRFTVRKEDIDFGETAGTHRAFKLIDALAKVLRIVRLFTINKRDSNQFILLLFQSMPHMLSLVMFLVLTTYIYAIVGMEMFSGKFPNGELPSDPALWAEYDDYHNFASFDTLGKSMLLLVQLLTTSGWHEIFFTGRQALRDQMGNDTAANAISTIYFISFMVLMVNIILNLVLAVFVDSWTQMTSISKKLKQKLLVLSKRQQNTKGRMRNASVGSMFTAHNHRSLWDGVGAGFGDGAK